MIYGFRVTLIAHRFLSAILPPMSPSAKILTALGFLASMLLLASADAFFTYDNFYLYSYEEEPTPDAIPAEPAPSNEGGGVAKQIGPDVGEALASLGLEAKDGAERSILRRVIPEGVTVQTSIVLKDGDRIGMISWTQSPLVKNYFLALKEAIHTSFTPQMKDLVDETQRPEKKPVRNFLSFLDPGLSPERMVFVRVRDRLYEFRITEGFEEQMFLLIEELTN